MNDSPSNRPTVWMVIAGVCALAAIGLGIWAFTTKSDLDDANSKIDQLEQQGASEEQTAEASKRACGRSASASAPPTDAFAAA